MKYYPIPFHSEKKYIKGQSAALAEERLDFLGGPPPCLQPLPEHLWNGPEGVQVLRVSIEMGNEYNNGMVGFGRRRMF